MPAALSRRLRLYVICAYILGAAFLIWCYAAILHASARVGVDFACFRAAALVLLHGGNPYDFAQLWHAETSLYNAPAHLSPGDPRYYAFDRYYNPPLFAIALWPLAGLPYALGYVLYAGAIILAIVGAGVSLVMVARVRTWGPVLMAALLASPCLFMTLWSGQQSAFVFLGLAVALLCLSRRRISLAGAVMALAWIKPHLLLPVALLFPLALPRADVRAWYQGLALGTAAGAAVTVAISGVSSLAHWAHTLVGYTGYVDAIQTYLPSLSGSVLVLAPHPWNRWGAAMLMGLGVVIIGITLYRMRVAHVASWRVLAALVALWLCFTPFAHTNDDILLYASVAAAWMPERPALRRVALLTGFSLLLFPLALMLPYPWRLLGVVPPIVASLIPVCLAVRPREARRQTAPTRLVLRWATRSNE